MMLSGREYVDTYAQKVKAAAPSSPSPDPDRPTPVDPPAALAA
jgi:hypothetical protein